MNTKEIQALIAKEQLLKNHNPVCENVKYLFSDWEHDVISVSKTGYIYEFEVKISRSDFLADQKKKLKIQCYSLAVTCPNYFYYVCPEGLITGLDLPKYAGLIHIINGEAVVIRKAPLLHNRKPDKLKVFEKLYKLMACRHYLGAAPLTLKNKAIKERNEQRQKGIPD